jgi:hypothetical protein
MEYFNHFWPVCKLKTAAAGRAFQGALSDGRTAPRQSLEQRVIALASRTPNTGIEPLFSGRSSKRIYVEACLLGCAAGLALSSLSFGLGFAPGM